MPIIVKDLKYIYCEGTPMETVALDNVSLDIHNGDFWGIVGHTGSGKSTLMQHLNGLLTPLAGYVEVDSVRIVKGMKNIKDIRRKVGLVFQYPEQQLFAETIFDEIAFAPRNMGVPEGAIASIVAESLNQVGLHLDTKDKSPFSISGGQKRKVALASVLAMKPGYLVMDEPTAGLDSEGRDNLMETIKKLQRSGITIIMVSHDLDLLAPAADKMAVLSSGKIVAVGTPEDVLAQVENDVSSGLLLPQIGRICSELKKKGWNIPITFDDSKAARNISRELNKRWNS